LANIDEFGSWELPVTTRRERRRLRSGCRPDWKAGNTGQRDNTHGGGDGPTSDSASHLVCPPRSCQNKRIRSARNRLNNSPPCCGKGDGSVRVDGIVARIGG